MAIDFLVKYTSSKVIRAKIKEGKVVICAPKACSRAKIDEFLRTYEKKILLVLDKQNFNKQKAERFVESGNVLYCGSVIDLPECYRDFDKGYKLFYKTKFVELERRAIKLAKMFNFTFSQVGPTSAKSYWGICNCNGTIRLNLRLIMLPEKLIDYVVIHELVHTKFMNHGGDFWREVARFVPEYKILRKELKQYAWVFGIEM